MKINYTITNAVAWICKPEGSLSPCWIDINSNQRLSTLEPIYEIDICDEDYELVRHGIDLPKLLHIGWNNKK
jgi:hypothetical protein